MPTVHSLSGRVQGLKFMQRGLAQQQQQQQQQLQDQPGSSTSSINKQPVHSSTSTLVQENTSTKATVSVEDEHWSLPIPVIQRPIQSSKVEQEPAWDAWLIDREKEPTVSSTGSARTSFGRWQKKEELVPDFEESESEEIDQDQDQEEQDSNQEDGDDSKRHSRKQYIKPGTAAKLANQNNSNKTQSKHKDKLKKKQDDVVFARKKRGISSGGKRR